MNQQQVKKQSQKKTEEIVEDAQIPEKADLSATDDLLDEIDLILEENAAQFVRDYIQKGGQ